MASKSKKKNGRGSSGNNKNGGGGGDVFAPRSKSNLAGLTFPVSRIRRYMKTGGYAHRVSIHGAVFLSGILEYLAVEVLELSGNAAKDNKQQRIKPRYIQLAIKQDEELCQLLHNVTIRDGGVLPHIHEELTKGKNKGKKYGGKNNYKSQKKSQTESQEY